MDSASAGPVPVPVGVGYEKHGKLVAHSSTEQAPDQSPTRRLESRITRRGLLALPLRHTARSSEKNYLCTFTSPTAHTPCAHQSGFWASVIQEAQSDGPGQATKAYQHKPLRAGELGMDFLNVRRARPNACKSILSERGLARS